MNIIKYFKNNEKCSHGNAIGVFYPCHDQALQGINPVFTDLLNMCIQQMIAALILVI